MQSRLFPVSNENERCISMLFPQSKPQSPLKSEKNITVPLLLQTTSVKLCLQVDSSGLCQSSKMTASDYALVENHGGVQHEKFWARKWRLEVIWKTQHTVESECCSEPSCSTLRSVWRVFEARNCVSSCLQYYGCAHRTYTNCDRSSWETKTISPPVMYEAMICKSFLRHTLNQLWFFKNYGTAPQDRKSVV